MKLVIGKTYGSLNGDSFKIIVKCAQAREGFPFVGINLRERSVALFSESGIGCGTEDPIRLNPNTVKREGWINVYDVSSDLVMFPTGRSAVEIYDSEAAAKSNVEEYKQSQFRYLATTKIAWEEEET